MYWMSHPLTVSHALTLHPLVHTDVKNIPSPLCPSKNTNFLDASARDCNHVPLKLAHRHNTVLELSCLLVKLVVVDKMRSEEEGEQLVCVRWLPSPALRPSKLL